MRGECAITLVSQLTVCKITTWRCGFPVTRTRSLLPCQYIDAMYKRGELAIGHSFVTRRPPDRVKLQLNVPRRRVTSCAISMIFDIRCDRCELKFCNFLRRINMLRARMTSQSREQFMQNLRRYILDRKFSVLCCGFRFFSSLSFSIT